MSVYKAMKLIGHFKALRLMTHSSRNPMKTRLILVTIAFIFVADSAISAEKNKAVSISAGENTAESVVPELSEIVVLCATEKEKQFKKEWSRYVAHNDLKGNKLQETITWVSDEAASQRKHTKRMLGEENDEEAWKAEREKLMKEIARQAMMR